jgi:glycosyltransferase A (GT-A) superfamily protein (DUF2064 family)
VPAPVPPRPAVLMMTRAPRPGTVRRALEPLLGRERCAALQLALIDLAAAWANTVAPGALHVAHEPADAGPELRALLGPDVAVFPQNGDGIAGRLADATARVFARSEGPLLIIWPELARWRPEHASGALDDLEAGCDVALGPVIDGGFYLVAIARPLPTLFSLPERVWRSPDVMAIAIAAAHDTGLEVGILRVERALHRPDDVRAALSDPLLAPTFAAILGGG